MKHTLVVDDSVGKQRTHCLQEVSGTFAVQGCMLSLHLGFLDCLHLHVKDPLAAVAEHRLQHRCNAAVKPKSQACHTSAISRTLRVVAVSGAFGAVRMASRWAVTPLTSASCYTQRPLSRRERGKRQGGNQETTF